MKSASFFKGLSWLIALNLLVKPVWIFFIDRQVQNIVGFEAYGKYFALLNLSYVLLFLADAGLTTMLSQRVASRSSINLGQLVGLKFILLGVYIAACCLIAWLAGITQWDLLIYIIIIQAFTSLFVFMRSNITAQQYFSADAWFSILDKTLMTLICGAIIYTSFFGTIHLELFLQIQLACTAVAVLSTFLFLYRKKLFISSEKMNIAGVIRMILPFAILILLMSGHYRLDGFLLERLHSNGSFEAGIYASAYRLLDAGNMVGYLAASFLVPFIARHQNEKKLVENTIIHTRHGLVLLGIGVSCFGILFAPWIQEILYHSTEKYNTEVIAISIAVLPAYYLVHIYGSLLTATSQFRLFGGILACSVLINVILNLILIPSYGAKACSISAIASQYFCGISCAVLASGRYQIAIHYPSILAYGAFAVLLSGFFYFASVAINNVWIILAGAVCIALVVLATQFRSIKKYFFSLR